jgi:hypothetical protein
MKGRSNLVDFQVSGIREIRVRELDPLTREVGSSENERRKVNIASRRFMKERCQGWTFKLAKSRVARSASTYPSWWSHEEGDDRGRVVLVSTFQVS